MCVVSLIRDLKISETEVHMIKNDLLSWPNVAQKMSLWTKPEEALKFLKVELESRARLFYITRLYGRWRKLLPREDWTNINSYIKEVHNGKS